jgi:hypothetical protein
VAYLLLADSHTFRCKSWNELVAKPVWARENGYRQAQARCCWTDFDRPLLPSERVELVQAATVFAFANRPNSCCGDRSVGRLYFRGRALPRTARRQASAG